MSEMLLSEDLKYWRAERPDEWTMDEFIRKATKLENTSTVSEEIERLTQECIKAKNYIVELSDTLTQQSTEIDRLRCCGNCVHNMSTLDGYFCTVHGLDNNGEFCVHNWEPTQ